jgi:hypothetical protein
MKPPVRMRPSIPMALARVFLPPPSASRLRPLSPELPPAACHRRGDSHRKANQTVAPRGTHFPDVRKGIEHLPSKPARHSGNFRHLHLRHAGQTARRRALCNGQAALVSGFRRSICSAHACSSGGMPAPHCRAQQANRARYRQVRHRKKTVRRATTATLPWASALRVP